MKEGAERDNLVSYLEDLFSACLGANSDTKVTIVKAYRQEPSQKINAAAKDILVQFPTWEIKNKVQGTFRSQPGLKVDGLKGYC